MSFKVTLDEENMDVVMSLVREFDKRPFEIINMILKNPELVMIARSKLYEKSEKDKCSKRGKRE